MLMEIIINECKILFDVPTPCGLGEKIWSK